MGLLLQLQCCVDIDKGYPLQTQSRQRRIDAGRKGGLDTLPIDLYRDQKYLLTSQATRRTFVPTIECQLHSALLSLIGG